MWFYTSNIVECGCWIVEVKRRTHQYNGIIPDVLEIFSIVITIRLTSSISLSKYFGEKLLSFYNKLKCESNKCKIMQWWWWWCELSNSKKLNAIDVLCDICKISYIVYHCYLSCFHQFDKGALNELSECDVIVKAKNSYKIDKWVVILMTRCCFYAQYELVECQK